MWNPENPGGSSVWLLSLQRSVIVRSSPSVHQRRHDRSRTHRSLWPSHPASAYPRCLRITQHPAGRERWGRKGKQRERQGEARATQSCMSSLPTARESRGETAPSSGPQLYVRPIPTAYPLTNTLMRGGAIRRTVLLKRVEGHRHHKVTVGTQTHFIYFL